MNGLHLQREFGSALRIIFHFHTPTMRLGDTLDNRKPQTLAWR